MYTRLPQPWHLRATMPSRKTCRKLMRVYQRAEAYCKQIEDASFIPADAAAANFYRRALDNNKLFMDGELNARYNLALFRRVQSLRDMGWRHPIHGGITLTTPALSFRIQIDLFLPGKFNYDTKQIECDFVDEKEDRWHYDAPSYAAICRVFCTAPDATSEQQSPTDTTSIADVLQVIEDPMQRPTRADFLALVPTVPVYRIMQSVLRRLDQFQLSGRAPVGYPQGTMMLVMPGYQFFGVRFEDNKFVDLQLADPRKLRMFSYDPFLEFLKGVDTKSSKPNNSNVRQGLLQHPLYDRNILGLIYDRDNPISRRYQKSMAREEALARRAEAEANKGKQPRLQDPAEEKEFV